MKNLFFLVALFVGSTALAQNTSFLRVINNDSIDKAYSSFQTSNGDYFILSSTNSSGQGATDMQVAKTNGLGATLWSYTYGTSSEDVGTKMKPTADGGAVICGYTKGFVSTSTDDDAFVIKLNSSGTVQWTKYLRTDSNERALDIVEARNGVFYVAGYVKLDTMDINMLVARIDATGSVSWIKTFGGDGDDVAYSIAEDVLGRIIVAGSTENDSVTVGGAGDMDMSLIALTTGGNIELSKNFGTVAKDYATVVKTHSDNNIYVAGNTEGGSGASIDVFLCELDTNFSIIANSWYGGIVGTDKLLDIKVRSNNKVLIATASENSAIIKNAWFYEVESPSAGVFLATELGGTMSDAVSSISIMGADNSGYSVLTSGLSFGNTSSEDLYLYKFNSSLMTDCGSGMDFLDFGPLVFSNGNFSNSGSNGASGNMTFVKSSITNSDSTLCCKLEARSIADSLAICTGDFINIGRQSISGYIYSWTAIGGTFTSGSANPSVSPSQTTEYKLVVSSSDGLCTPDSTLVHVKVNARMTTVDLMDDVLCEGDSITFEGTSGMNYYQWRTKNFTSNEASIKLYESDTITLTMIDTNSCLYLDTVAVESKALPQFNLGSDTTICENLSLTLSGPVGMQNYNWNGTDGTSNTFITATAQIHELEVTDSFGCKYNDEILILTNPSSSFSLGNDTTICENEDFSIYILAALSDYKWNDVSSSSSEYKVLTAGTYLAEAKNSFGCPSFDTIVVSTYDLPEFSLGSDTGFCDNINYQLKAPLGVKEYLWSDTSTLPLLNVSGAGEYSLKVTDNNDCSFSDTISVALYSSPTISLGPDTIIPASGVLVLTPGSGFVLYDWSTGEKTESIQVSDTGTYSVIVTDDNGCIASDAVRVPSSASIVYVNGVIYKLYPNPVTTSFRVSTEANLAGSIVSIIDVQGKTVLNEVLRGNDHFIDVSELNSGLYRFILSTDSKTLTFNVVVNH
ncbi:T9SS type A sorting domain-containing protein [Bacteroidia bacterium]|nr:T9SS type A sorting domain-containing protein [Bacteroidia bacterium]